MRACGRRSINVGEFRRWRHAGADDAPRPRCMHSPSAHQLRGRPCSAGEPELTR